MSLSTTEAEYRALTDGAKEAINLKRLLIELGFLDTIEVPISLSDSNIISNLSNANTPSVMDVTLRCDNMGAIKLPHNPVFHSRSKHIEIQHHFVRERILEGKIKVNYISTDKQQADLLTKSLARAQFEFHRENIGVTNLQALLMNQPSV